MIPLVVSCFAETSEHMQLSEVFPVVFKSSSFLDLATVLICPAGTSFSHFNFTMKARNNWV